MFQPAYICGRHAYQHNGHTKRGRAGKTTLTNPANTFPVRPQNTQNPNHKTRTKHSGMAGKTTSLSAINYPEFETLTRFVDVRTL